MSLYYDSGVLVLFHVATALDRTASGLVSLDYRQCAAARASGLDVIELPA